MLLIWRSKRGSPTAEFFSYFFSELFRSQAVDEEAERRVQSHHEARHDPEQTSPEVKFNNIKMFWQCNIGDTSFWDHSYWGC